MVSERLLLTKLTYNSLVQKLWRQRCPFNMSKRKVRMKWQSPVNHASGERCTMGVDVNFDLLSE